MGQARGSIIPGSRVYFVSDSVGGRQAPKLAEELSLHQKVDCFDS
jgi:hypothetical protein